MIKHNKFVKTPVISDALALQVFQRGQWVQLAWLDHKSRYYGTNGRSLTAFHYPRANSQFAEYSRAMRKSA